MRVSLDRPGPQARPLHGAGLPRGLVAAVLLAACSSGATVIVPRPDFGGGLAIAETTSPSGGGGTEALELERAMREACFPLGFWVRGSLGLEDWTIVPALLPSSAPVKGQRWAMSYECVDGEVDPYAHRVLTPFLPPPAR